MKTHYKILFLATAAWVISTSSAQAQVVNRAYFQADWQLNVPLNNPDFAHKLSGWGMNFEGGYFLKENISLGLFLAYHTNNEHVGKKTYTFSNNSVITTDMQQSRFQLPFGVVARYYFEPERVVQPYVSARIGASFARLSAFYSVYESYEDTWGVYLSPEIGINIFPNPDRRLGIHIGAYYAYASNKGDVFTYQVNGLSDLGVRVGIVF